MTIYSNPRLVPSGGYVLHVEVCDEVSIECNAVVHSLYYRLLRFAEDHGIGGVEVVPTYSAVTIFYDPRQTSRKELTKVILEFYPEALKNPRTGRPRTYRIPVCYGGEYGPDMRSVVELTGLSEKDIIRIHSSRKYRCYMLGFTPGFIYLGDVDDRIAVPRLSNPRTKIPPGSVGIAGKQTGVYGVESPGGWRLIGRTPVRMFDPARDPPIPIRPGDLVEFYPVSVEEFREMFGKYVLEVQ